MDGASFGERPVETRGYELTAEERAYVRRSRSAERPRSWQAISQFLGRSVDLIRRECDPDYVSLTPTRDELKARVPTPASGRTARGGVAWSEPTPAEKPPPIPSLVTPPAPRPPRPELKGPAVAPHPKTPERVRIAPAAEAALEHRGLRTPPPPKPFTPTVLKTPAPGLSPEPAAGGAVAGPASRTSTQAMADLCARAIIAAAGAMSIDPVIAVTAHRTHRAKNAMTAAASGFQKGSRQAVHVVAARFGVSHTTIYTARCNDKASFRAGEAAAEAATRWNMKQEARP